MEFIYILIILIIIIASYYFINLQTKKNNLFYSVDEIEPELNLINKIKYQILEETTQVYKTKQNLWIEWSEKELYSESKSDGWMIFPFFAFGIWVKENCEKCPEIYKFIKNIPHLKLATLSKLKGGTKLKEHKGWASHSNYVIRCHYGLIIPEKSCYIYVRDDKIGKSQKVYHNKFEWLIFDDSKIHYAHNQSEEDRIVLIIDITRPNNIQIGESDIGDSKELIEIINYFKQKNIKI